MQVLEILQSSLVLCFYVIDSASANADGDIGNLRPMNRCSKEKGSPPQICGKSATGNTKGVFHMSADKMHFLTLRLLDAGDKEASKQVKSALRRYFQKTRILPECIDDAIQDTLEIALKKRSALRPDKAYRFLRGIARNVGNRYREQLAKRNQRFVALEPETKEEDAQPTAIDVISFEVSTGGLPLDERIAFRLQYQEVLEDISPQKSRCWQLTKEQGYTTAEVAALLHIPTGTVKFFVHEVRHELRSKLHEWEIT